MKKDILFLIKKKLSDEIKKILFELQIFSKERNVELYVVGGFVRDIFLNKENMDIDFTVVGNAISFSKSFAFKYKKKIKNYVDFGTSTVIYSSKIKLDFVSSRKEEYLLTGSLPKIKFSTIEYDLLRRDFTINSLAIRIDGDYFGEFLDVSSGEKDLRNNILRVHNKESFINDPIRILRIIRFKQRFDFKIEERTELLMMKALKKNVFDFISKERIRDELIKACYEFNNYNFFYECDYLGILKMLDNNLILGKNQIEFLKDINERVFDKNFKCIYSIVAIVSEMKMIEGLNFLKKYKFSKIINKTAKEFFDYKYNIRRELKQESDEYVIYTLFKKFTKKTIEILEIYEKNESVKKVFFKYKNFSKIKLNINGDDLIKMGLLKGTEIGDVLKEILKIKIKGRKLTKPDEIKLAEQIIIKKDLL